MTVSQLRGLLHPVVTDCMPWSVAKLFYDMMPF
jgi:hypothetical protein